MFPFLIKPSPRLRSKYRLLAWLMLGSQLLWSVPLGLAIGWDEGRMTGAAIGLGVVLLLHALWFLPALWLVDRYFDSISYELQEDEIVTRVGIWTHSVKHVPFRTVTNIAVNRDIFDRFLFSIGTVEVQTAGAAGAQQGAEETLAGLVDYDGVYEIIANALRRFRTMPLSPTQTGADLTSAMTSPVTDLTPLLAEVRALRTLLDERLAPGGK